MLLLSAIFWAVALVLFLALALLATPLHIALSAEFGGTTRFTLDLRPFWGLCPRFRVRGAGAEKGASPERRRRKKARRDAKTSRSPLARRFLRAMPRLVLAELRRNRLDRLHLDVAFGTGDPAGTGTLYGGLMPLAHALPAGAFDLSLRPDFARTRFEAHVFAAIHLVPAALAWPVLKVLVGGRA
jgi:hypothetical protein